MAIVCWLSTQCGFLQGSKMPCFLWRPLPRPRRPCSAPLGPCAACSPLDCNLGDHLHAFDTAWSPTRLKIKHAMLSVAAPAPPSAPMLMLSSSWALRSNDQRIACSPRHQHLGMLCCLSKWCDLLQGLRRAVLSATPSAPPSAPCCCCCCGGASTTCALLPIWCTRIVLCARHGHQLSSKLAVSLQRSSAHLSRS